MINILLNINNFGDGFAKPTLRRIIKRRHRVLIIPFSYHEDYVRNSEEFKEHFSKTSPEIQEIVQEFGKYGIHSKNIRILNYYDDSKETIENKFKRANILFFTGGYPDRLLYRIDQLGIRDRIKNFKGIVMGTSAGAMIQLDRYHVTPEDNNGEYEYHDGLGLISGFDIEVHYEDDCLHLSSLITDLKLHDKTIYAMPNEGGLVVKGNRITEIGNTFALTSDDIDALQFVLDEIIEKRGGDE